MEQWKIEFYQLPDGSSPILTWFREQEPEVQAEFAHIFDLLQEHGISVGMPHVRPIVDSKLYEIRVRQNKNIYRIFEFAYTGRRFILLHGFQKKTQKTPKKELEIAESRMKAFLEREKQEKTALTEASQPSGAAKKTKSQKRSQKK